MYTKRSKQLDDVNNGNLINRNKMHGAINTCNLNISLFNKNFSLIRISLISPSAFEHNWSLNCLLT